MLGKLIPVILALVGLGAGVGGGLMLRPDPAEVAMDNPCGDVAVAGKDDHGEKHAEDGNDEAHDYVKLNNQFVVPVVHDGLVEALVVMSLSLEVAPGDREAIFEREPKLRDALLQVLFDHANSGGFKGSFTNSSRMLALRNALREKAQSTFGPTVTDVLIMDIVRQDT